MTDENSNDDVGTPEEDAQEIQAKAPMDPVRKWTLIVLGACVVLMFWYLRSDRVTPYTNQARVHALVVPIAARVSGIVTDVAVANNEYVSADQELLQIDRNRYELAVETAQANLQSARQATGASTANGDAARASVACVSTSSDTAPSTRLTVSRNIATASPGLSPCLDLTRPMVSWS